MKNIFVYYTAILLPLGSLVWVSCEQQQKLFVSGLLLYALLYRPVTDYLRLKGMGLVTHHELPMFFIPFYYSFRYFRSLYIK